MIKNTVLPKNHNNTHKKKQPASNISLLEFLKKGVETITQKSENALNKIHQKIIEEPNVYVLPPEVRKKMSSQDRTPRK